MQDLEKYFKTQKEGKIYIGPIDNLSTKIVKISVIIKLSFFFCIRYRHLQRLCLFNKLFSKK